jgi:FkbM family methyltransferase
MPDVRRLAARLVVLAWRIVGRRQVVRLARFVLDQSRLDVPNALHSNGERLLQRAALTLAADGGPLTIFDVGANIGEWTQSMLHEAATRSVPITIHAFEPSEYTFEKLLATRPADCVVPRRLALSDHTGTLPLFIVHPGAGRNSLYVQAGHQQAMDVEVVPVTTVDAYCAEQRIERIDLLKVDTEGHDLAVLRGAQRLLRNGQVGLVQFEYNHCWITARVFLRDAFEFFSQFGYCVGKVTPYGFEFYPGWDPELETFREANYLACRAERVAGLPRIRWWKLG